MKIPLCSHFTVTNRIWLDLLPQRPTICVSFVYLGQAQALLLLLNVTFSQISAYKNLQIRLSLERVFLQRIREGQAQTFRERSSCNLTLFVKRESEIERFNGEKTFIHSSLINTPISEYVKGLWSVAVCLGVTANLLVSLTLHLCCK